MAEKFVPGPNFQHIVRISNVDVPGAKKILFALKKIKGVGDNFASAVCAAAGVNINTRAGELKSDEIERLTSALNHPAKSGIPSWMYNRRKDFDTGEDKHLITGTLIFTHDNDLKRMKKIKSYKGLRHIKGLPVRGQRTRSNFRRSKGKVVGVTKKKATPGSDNKDKKSADKGSKKGKK